MPINWPDEKTREQWEAARASRLAGEAPAQEAEEGPEPADTDIDAPSAGKGKAKASSKP